MFYWIPACAGMTKEGAGMAKIKIRHSHILLPVIPA
jgi:hypothetical protein